MHYDRLLKNHSGNYMSFTAHFDDLSDEGLDLLMRVVLKTDVRQIDNWNALGALIEQQRITLTYIKEELWSADIEGEDEETASEFGDHARAAIARVVIRSKFPEGISFHMPRSSIQEVFRESYLASALGKIALMQIEMEHTEEKVIVHLS